MGGSYFSASSALWCPWFSNKLRVSNSVLQQIPEVLGVFHLATAECSNNDDENAACQASCSGQMGDTHVMLASLVFGL